MVLLFSSKIGKNKLDISFEYIQMMSSARGSPGTLSSAPLRLRVSVDGFRLSRKQKRAPWCPGAAAAGAVIIAVVCSRWRPGEPLVLCRPQRPSAVPLTNASALWTQPAVHPWPALAGLKLGWDPVRGHPGTHGILSHVQSKKCFLCLEEQVRRHVLIKMDFSV